MKIGYFADGPWAHKAIQLITDSPNLEIVFIVPRFDTQDPVLKAWAEKLEVPYIPHENVNSEKFLNIVGKLGADLFVSMSFNQILKNKIIKFAPKGFINCHAGALPFYRGRNPLNWALINGEKQFGITVHYVDEGIDTGDILEQKIYPISFNDTYATLLEKSIFECAYVLYNAVMKILRGEEKAVSQQSIHPVGTYFGIRTFGDEIIDFNWSAERVYNFIRGISAPGPNARCFLGRQEYAIVTAELIPNAPSYIATVGEVVGRCAQGIIVKVGDSTILLTQMAEISERQSTFIPNFRIGTRFTLKE